MFDANLAFIARTRPRALAVLTSRRRATYAEFNADIDRYAAGLRDLGVGPERGVVSIATAAPYRRMVLLVALARLGVATTAGSDARADLRITDRAGGEEPGLLRLSADWLQAVEASVPNPVDSAPRDPDAIARVTLTSGSTRTPHRVGMTWRRIETGSLNALTAYAGGKLGVYVLRTSIESSLGFNMAALAWSTGAAVACDYASADIPHVMERHPEGMIGLNPLMLRELMRRLPPGFEIKPGWRLLVTGGVLPPAYAREARQRITPDIHVIYGSTEAGRATVGPARDVEAHPGAVGYAVPGATVEVVGPDGTPMPDGEVGEIRIHGERNAGRYLDDPDASAKIFRDGWFYPGDLGRRLPSGLFIIEGRTDERLNIAGFKLMPAVLENALLEHPQVLESAAFAVPGPEGIDQCWVAVVVEGEVSRESLLERIGQAGLPKVPVRFAWAEEIPRTEAGKVDRKALRAQTQAALEKNSI